VHQERPELLAEPQRAVRRLAERLDVEIGAGEQSLAGAVDDRPRSITQ
jgi:hypothetical protein